MAEPKQTGETPTASAAPSGHAIHLTPRAAQKMLTILADQGTPDYGVRIGVRGGGCTGLSYVIEPCPRPDSRDQVFEVQGVKVFVDPKSYLYVRGMEIDFKPLGMGFTFTNPNAKKSCGCGESFSV
jgi:iron-sulfur cluster assembly protein